MNCEQVSKEGAAVTMAAQPIRALVKQIDPASWDAYSSNLVKWLKANGRDGDCVFRLRAGAKLERVYGPGAMFVGQKFSLDDATDTDFSGALLMGTLTFGRDAPRHCHAGLFAQLQEIEGFWQQYIDRGRCAIDPDHRVMFRENNRIVSRDGKSLCAWCSAEVAGH